MDFDPSSAKPVEFDPSSAKPEERAAPAKPQKQDFRTPMERYSPERVGDIVMEKTGSPALAAGSKALTAVLPGVFGGEVGAAAGASAGAPLAKSAAEHLMTSALKPTLEAARTGKAARAIKTMLDEGISVSKGGMTKLRGLIDELNQEIKQKITSSTATVNKRAVADYLDSLTQKLKSQVNPQADLASIRKSLEDFMEHPSLAGKSEIPVQEAQKLKSGTYKALSERAYGEEKSAATEAQKTLARGLKEEIAKKVPEISGLNKRETELLNALNVTERRMLVELNKNPAGLSLLSHSPSSALAFMADRSAAFKSLAAKLIHRYGAGASRVTGGTVGAGGMAAQRALSDADSTR